MKTVAIVNNEIFPFFKKIRIINTLVIDRNQSKTIDNEKEQKVFAKSLIKLTDIIRIMRIA